MAKAFKFPKKIGECADRLYALKTMKSDAQKVVTTIEEEEKALKAHIIEVLPKSEASGVSGKFANAKVVTKIVPSISAEGWPLFYAYIKKKNAFELLQRRPSEGAIAEIWASKDGTGKIPGVEKFNAVTVSVTKI